MFKKVFFAIFTAWIYWYFICFMFFYYGELSIKYQIIIISVAIIFGIIMEYFFKIRMEIMILIKIILITLSIYFNTFLVKIAILFFTGYFYVIFLKLICIPQFQKRRISRRKSAEFKTFIPKIQRYSCIF